MQYFNQRLLNLFLVMVISFGVLSGCLHDKETKPTPAASSNGDKTDKGNDTSGLPTVSVNILGKDNFRISEGLGFINIAVSLDKSASKDIDIALSLKPGTATPANDFSFVTAGRNPLSIQFKVLAGKTSPEETIQLRITPDNVYEGDETFLLSVKATGANVPSKPVTYTIVDNDEIPVVQIKEFINNEPIPTKAIETNGSLEIHIELYPSALPTELDIPFSFIASADTETRAEIGVDFSYPDSIKIPAEASSTVFTILTTGDAVIENTETFNFKLIEITEPEGIKLGKISDVVLSIIDDDTFKDLNETGQTLCANATNPVEDCSNTTEFPAQDANYERNGGEFNFTTLGIDGVSDPTAANPATCVRDNLTNLTWELKSSAFGFQNNLNEYSWFNPQRNANGGNPGLNGSNIGCGLLTGNGGPVACDTEKYAIFLNNEALCARKGWRTPTVSELQSILNFSNTTAENKTFANQDFFPNLQPGYYWSATPSVLDNSKAWAVYLGKELADDSEYTDVALKSKPYYLILVTNE